MKKVDQKIHYPLLNWIAGDKSFWSISWARDMRELWLLDTLGLIKLPNWLEIGDSVRFSAEHATITFKGLFILFLFKRKNPTKRQ